MKIFKQQQFNNKMGVQAKKDNKTRWNRNSLSPQSVNSKNDFKGRPKSRWRDDVENDIRKIGDANCRQVAQDRDEWRKAPREALMLSR
jgi:hypothetical protein